MMRPAVAGFFDEGIKEIGSYCSAEDTPKNKLYPVPFRISSYERIEKGPSDLDMDQIKGVRPFPQGDKGAHKVVEIQNKQGRSYDCTEMVHVKAPKTNAKVDKQAYPDFPLCQFVDVVIKKQDSCSKVAAIIKHRMIKFEPSPHAEGKEYSTTDPFVFENQEWEYQGHEHVILYLDGQTPVNSLQPAFSEQIIQVQHMVQDVSPVQNDYFVFVRTKKS